MKFTYNKSPPVPHTVGVPCVASGPVSGDCSCLLSSDVWQQRASAAEDTTAILRQPALSNTQGGILSKVPERPKPQGQGTYFMIVLSGFSNIPNHNSSQIMPPCSILSGQCIVGTAHHSPSPKEAIHNPVLLPLPTASNTALPNLSSQKISK